MLSMSKGQTVTTNVSGTDADDIQKEVTLAYLGIKHPTKYISERKDN